MINIYTGIPGSGKTYKMVADLKAILEKQPDLRVISNITELKLDHDNLEDLAQHYGVDLDTFFSWDFQSNRIHHDYGPVVYVVDECQRIFPAGKRQLDVETYFQLHRKLGHTLLMATQSLISVNRYIKPMFEMEYAAARRTMTFFGEFRYRVKSPTSKEIIETLKVRPKQEIYDLYTSFQANEQLKSKPKLFWRIFIPFLFVLPVVGFALYKNIGSPLTSEKPVPVPLQTRPVAPVEIEDRRFIPARVPIAQVEDLEREIEELKRKLNDQERVFLTVVEVGNRRLTVDPDTQAVIDIRFLKHKISCLNGGLTCYFDRPVNSGIKVADTSGRGGFSSSFSPGIEASSLPSNVGLANGAMMRANPNGSFLRARPNDSIGSFVEPSMVPPPDHVRLKVYNGLED